MSKYCLLLFLFIGITNFSQNKHDALRDAKITANATLKSDFETVVKHTYPPVVELMGGKENAINFIKKTFDDMKSQGFKFEKSEVVSVSKIVNEQNQYRCYVKNSYNMLINNQNVKSESYLLGIFNEKEKFWYFVEAKQLNSPLSSKILPDFKTSLNIPKGKTTIEE